MQRINAVRRTLSPYGRTAFRTALPQNYRRTPYVRPLGRTAYSDESTRRRTRADRARRPDHKSELSSGIYLISGNSKDASHSDQTQGTHVPLWHPPHAQGPSATRIKLSPTGTVNPFNCLYAAEKCMAAFQFKPQKPRKQRLTFDRHRLTREAN